MHRSVYLVHKFGGSVLRAASDFARLKQCLAWFSGWGTNGIVISALGKTTSTLETILWTHQLSRTRAWHQLEALTAYFARIAQQILTPREAHRYCQWLSQTLALLRKGPWTYGRLIPWGERWTARLTWSFLQEQGFRVAYLPATEWMVATGSEDNSTPVLPEIVRRFRVPPADFILTEGFIARKYPYSPENTSILCTLGREGSDLTATLLARVAQATRVIFWKGTGALWNADPANFQDAIPMRIVHRWDAYLIAVLGGKILHWRALTPILDTTIQIEFRALAQPWRVQTRILEEASDPSVPFIVLQKSASSATIYVIGNRIQVQWRHPWVRGAVWEYALERPAWHRTVIRVVGKHGALPRSWRAIVAEHNSRR